MAMVSWPKFEVEIKKIIIYVNVMQIYVNNRDKIFFFKFRVHVMLIFC